MSIDPNQTMEPDRITELATSISRQLIDIGAACQKARSFSVCTESTPLRSVYDVYAEKLEVVLRKHFGGASS